MPPTATIRDLRNHFPKVRKLIETEGEVLLSERGKPRYRLILYSLPEAKQAEPVNFWDRLTAYQPKALTAAQSRSLDEANRGER